MSANWSKVSFGREEDHPSVQLTQMCVDVSRKCYSWVGTRCQIMCRLLIRAATRDKFSRRMDSAGRLTGGYSSSLWTAILATDSSSGQHWGRWPNSISLTTFFAETVDVQLTFAWQKFKFQIQRMHKFKLQPLECPLTLLWGFRQSGLKGRARHLLAIKRSIRSARALKIFDRTNSYQTMYGFFQT